MQETEYVVGVIQALEQLQLPYMIVGSFASNVYGIVRSTKDVDIVIEFSGRKIRDIVSLLGPAYRLDPQVYFESVTGGMRHIIHLQDSPFHIELFQRSEDPHEKARFLRRRCNYSAQFQREIYLLTAEDVIITKLRWAEALGRGKDKDDARDVMAVQGPALDYPYIEHWCRQHGTWELLCQVRDSIPPEILEP